MKKALLLINLSIVTLLLNSCSSSQNTSTAPSPSPSPVQAPSPRAGATPAANPAPTGTPETVAQAPSAEIIPIIIPPGIEPSTNPQQRQASLSTGRRDPFAAIAVKPKVTILPSEGEKIGGGVPTGGTGKNGNLAPGGKAGGKSPSSGQTKLGEKMPPLPPPEPNLARDVIITGVVELNGIPYAIIQAPEEPFSRYVQSGQYLANGQVLVKRIDMYAGTPSVVLEQYGIQVTKQVGERPEPEKPETAAFIGNSTIALSGN